MEATLARSLGLHEDAQSEGPRRRLWVKSLEVRRGPFILKGILSIRRERRGCVWYDRAVKINLRDLYRNDVYSASYRTRYQHLELDYVRQVSGNERHSRPHFVGEILSRNGDKVSHMFLYDTGADSNWMPLKMAQDLGLRLMRTQVSAFTATNGSLGDVYLTLAKARFSKEGEWGITPFKVSEKLAGGPIVGYRWSIDHVISMRPGEGFTLLTKDGDVEYVPFKEVRGVETTRSQQGIHSIGELPSKDADIEDVQERESVYQRIQILKLDSRLTPEQQEALRNVLRRHWRVFRSKTGRTALTEHRIILEPGRKPPVAKLRRRSPAEATAERAKVQELLEKDMIEPSSGEFAFANVMVPKPDGRWRMTTDFRPLNDITVKDRYPIPQVRELLDWLGQFRYFSKLDLKDGFYQIPLAEESRDLTAMITPDGLFRYKVMPQGLCNAPPTFQRLMNRVLGPERWKNSVIYIDDLLVGTSSFGEHLEKLDRVLQRFEEAGLTFSLEKCEFLVQTFEYLGHETSPDGLRPNKKNRTAIQALKVPDNPTELQQFLGLTGWFRDFIPGYEQVASPLRTALKGLNLNKKKKFKAQRVPKPRDWEERFGPQQVEAFNRLKDLLSETTDRVLAHFDPEAPKVLDTDASGTALGAVLYQEDTDGSLKPLIFISKTFSKSERNYTTTEQECLAVIYAVNKCRHYIHGRHFVIRTDHQALRWLLSLKEARGRLARWALRLSEYDFDIVHKPGQYHVVPDALSRLPKEETEEDHLPIPEAEEMISIIRELEDLPEDMNPELLEMLEEDSMSEWLNAITRMSHRLSQEPVEVEVQSDEGLLNEVTFSLPSLEEIRSAYGDDELLIRHITPIDEGKRVDSYPEYFRDEDGIIHANTRRGVKIVLPNVTRVIQPVLNYFHVSPLGGHRGITATTERISARYYWPTMVAEIRDFVSACASCNAVKPGQHNRPQRPMRMISVTRKFEIVGIDVCTVRPVSKKGNSKILVVSDLFTKFVMAWAIPNETTIVVVQTLLDRWLTIFGLPEKILSDNGPNFRSNLFQAVCRRLGIQKVYTTPYHPQTNGQVERFNRTVVQYLSMYVSSSQDDWDDWLGLACYVYNSTPHSVTGVSPFKMIFGHDPPDWASVNGPYHEVIEPSNREISAHEYVENLSQKLADLYEQASISANRKKAAQARRYDQRVIQRPFLYKEGDLVYIWLPKLARGEGKKLTAPWIGPYRVQRVLPNDIHIIVAPIESDDRETKVHINRVRRVHPDLVEVSNLAGTGVPSVLADGRWIIDKIVGHRTRNGINEYKIHWFKKPSKEDSWENALAIPPLILWEYKTRFQRSTQPDADLEVESPLQSRRRA
jgi:hypothetical protein